MQLIENRIKKDIQEGNNRKETADLKLSEYKLIEAYDVTKRYEVKDENSGNSFHVTFYFYGDVISGWNVDKA